MSHKLQEVRLLVAIMVPDYHRIWSFFFWVLSKAGLGKIRFFMFSFLNIRLTSLSVTLRATLDFQIPVLLSWPLLPQGSAVVSFPS